MAVGLKSVYALVVIVFDIIGTLLDTHALGPFVRRVTGGKVSARQYFSDVTTYGMAGTLNNEYRPYEALACAVLQMSAAAHGIGLDEGDLQKLRKRLFALPPFPEVKSALRRLHDRGLRLAALSNASTGMLDQLIGRAGLGKYFEHVISIDAVEKFKPSREVYAAAVDRLGGGPHEMLMVASHPWDLMGAAKAGFRTALIRRAGKAPYAAAPAPNYDAANLHDFVDQLLGVEQQKPGGNHWLVAGCAVAVALAGTLALGPATGSSRVEDLSLSRE